MLIHSWQEEEAAERQRTKKQQQRKAKTERKHEQKKQLELQKQQEEEAERRESERQQRDIEAKRRAEKEAALKLHALQQQVIEQEQQQQQRELEQRRIAAEQAKAVEKKLADEVAKAANKTSEAVKAPQVDVASMKEAGKAEEAEFGDGYTSSSYFGAASRRQLPKSVRPVIRHENHVIIYTITSCAGTISEATVRAATAVLGCIRRTTTTSLCAKTSSEACARAIRVLLPTLCPRYTIIGFINHSHTCEAGRAPQNYNAASNQCSSFVARLASATRAVTSI